MNFIERYFRRRAMRRDETTEASLPSSLQAVPIGTVVAISGFNFRVMHRRCARNGRNPALVLAPVGPTRKRLKERRNILRALLRRGRAA